MIINTTVEIEPLVVPDSVFMRLASNLRQEGFQKTTGCPLSALDEEALEKLCKEFREEIFRKAGKQLPPAHSPYKSYEEIIEKRTDK